ncbi:hypothetical protein VI817_009474 [Penicillium citrinum]|nr:hypothetical protein VI817_009474 [Penicillium citrinum]
MSSSIKIPRAAGVGVTRPALSQLVTSNTSHSRSILGCARSYHAGNKDKSERISRRIDRYHRHPQANCRRKTDAREDWPATTHRVAGWGIGYWHRSRSSFSELSSGRDNSFWDAEHEQMARQISSTKKPMEEEHCNMLFGRRLGASYMEQNNARWPSFLWSFVEEEPAHSEPAKAHLQDFNFAHSPSSSSLGNPDSLQYDPISGRMVPKPPVESHIEGIKASVDCPPGSEVEAKLVSNPTVPEHNKTSAMVDSQSVDCPPGAEMEALYKSDSAALENPTITGVEHGVESARKPNINISCSPGSELEALFVSESVDTKQPQVETFKVKKSAKHFIPNSDLETSGNMECAPGSELEALFASSSVARENRSRPLNAFNPQSSGTYTSISVDCPPGEELEAKFATQLNLTDLYESSVATSQIECAPSSEVEAKIVPDTETRPSRAPESSVAGINRPESIDCSPGSELEALFAVDSASAKTAEKPSKLADTTKATQAPLTMDCTPGNELDAKLVSEAAAAGLYRETEDVSPLQASDIRARYASDIQYDGVEDRVGDFIKTSSKNASSAPFRILAYDAAASKVASSEADSFFGANEPVAPHKVLSRLHNPAKFVPYFEQMQQDGYEIATGGGDIIVFRRSSTAKITPIISPEVAARQEAIHADIAKYIRHDSYDSSELSSGPSTSKVSRQ